MAKISVIIPVYNTEKFLDKCINSLINQTQKDIEFIFVDDFSTDKSKEILMNYQSLYPNQIKVIQGQKRGGPGKARNLGLEVATGEYIGFIDSDDYITLDMYEELLLACEETNSDISRVNRQLVCGNYKIPFLGRNCPYQTSDIINPREDSRYLVKESAGATNKLYKRELIGDRKFPENLKWEDYPFVLPLITNANQIVTIPEKKYFYNMNLNSTTCTDMRKLNRRVLDIFTCSDIVGQECITEESNDNVKYLINYVQIKNCLHRLKEVTNANMPLQEKQELLTLMSELIKTKYGSWQDHDIYQERQGKITLNSIRMSIVENLLLPGDNFPKDEQTLKQKINVKLDKYAQK